MEMTQDDLRVVSEKKVYPAVIKHGKLWNTWNVVGFHGIYSEYNRRLKHGKLGVPEIMGFVPVKSSLDGWFSTATFDYIRG